MTGKTVKVCFADQGYTGEKTKEAVANRRVEMIIIKLPEGENRLCVITTVGSRTHFCLAGKVSAFNAHL